MILEKDMNKEGNTKKKRREKDKCKKARWVMIEKEDERKTKEKETRIIEDMNKEGKQNG